MHGQHFIDLAIELAEGGSEAAHCTAASHAYYGAFHVAMQLLSDAGIQLPDSAEAHRKLQFCLGECRENAGERAGERLELLRRRRNTADYNLREQAFQQKVPAHKAIIMAQHIVAMLATVRAEPVWSRFRAAVRGYASEVLRLPVT